MNPTLLVGLVGIAAVDSLNPSALVVTTLLLAGPNPYRRALAYVAGISLTYFCVGVAVLIGAGDVLIDAVEALRRPAIGFGIEAVLGALLVTYGLRSTRAGRGGRGASSPTLRGSSVPAAFVTGMTVTAVESTTALPYIGALTALARANASLAATLFALALYNVVFVVPPLALVGLQVARPGTTEAFVARARRTITALDNRVTRAAIAAIGVLMLADAAYFFITGESAF